MYKGVIERYRKFLPINCDTQIISINEGNTPLIYAENLSAQMGINLYLKFEGLNPTGSFKDRGMTLAITKACEDGANAVICASTGNTSASAAAYAAKAGIPCFVILPEGKVALGKLAQALAYGAKVISINGNFDQALEIVQDLSQRFNMTVVNSINPYRIECQKTAAFEIVDDLEKCPDYVFIPVGNAGNITAYWRGFCEYYEKGFIDVVPKMMGYQAAGSAPIVSGEIVKNPETIATAIRIGNPVSWENALKARDQSNGVIDSVTDEQILKAYKSVATNEGIFAEPGSAASVAGLYKALEQGLITPNSTVVAILTGHGLKDPELAIKESDEVYKVSASKAEVNKLVSELLNHEN